MSINTLVFLQLIRNERKNILWCILVGSTIQIKKGPSLCCNTTLVYDKLINKKVFKGNSDTFCNVSDFSCSNEWQSVTAGRRVVSVLTKS